MYGNMIILSCVSYKSFFLNYATQKKVYNGNDLM